jgi:hypothetical protein
VNPPDRAVLAEPPRAGRVVDSFTLCRTLCTGHPLEQAIADLTSEIAQPVVSPVHRHDRPLSSAVFFARAAAVIAAL